MMTDKEVIDILCDCFNKDHKVVTAYNGNTNTTIHLTIADICNVINRLQAENERLEREVFTYKIRWAKSVVRETKAKAEAYKEFAELVKTNKRKLFNYIYSSKGFDNQIDNLLKEKVGDK